MNKCLSVHPCGCPGHRSAPLSRREMLQTSANGFGLLALSAMLTERAGADSPRPGSDASALPKPHFHTRAKNVIFCFMDGGVSHVDSFDPKPKLAQLDGKEPGKIDNPTANTGRKWLVSPWKFHKRGQSGMPVSELFPHIAGVADEIAVIRSMKADLPIHSTGVLRLHTGVNNAGRPSLGSWVSYGLGSENRNLPGFVVLSFGVIPCGGLETFSSGFLPASYQAPLFHDDGTPLATLVPADRDRRIQRAKLDLLRQQDEAFGRSLGGDDAVESAIRNHEMAYRMQSLVPDVLDMDRESAATKKLYGI